MAYLNVRHRMFARNHNVILLIRVANLLLASFGVLTSVLAAAHSGWHFSSRNIVLGSLDFVWLIAALGLFFRWRIAWIGSLTGAGVSACFWGFYLVTFGWSAFSSADWFRHQDSFVISIFALLITVGLILALFSAAFGLFVGLVRMRKELV